MFIGWAKRPPFTTPSCNIRNPSQIRSAVVRRIRKNLARQKKIWKKNIWPIDRKVIPRHAVRTILPASIPISILWCMRQYVSKMKCRAASMNSSAQLHRKKSLSSTFHKKTKTKTLIKVENTHTHTVLRWKQRNTCTVENIKPIFGMFKNKTINERRVHPETIIYLFSGKRGKKYNIYIINILVAPVVQLVTSKPSDAGT